MLRRFAACTVATFAVLAGCSRDDASSVPFPLVASGVTRPLTQGPATSDHHYAVGVCLDGSPGNCTTGTCSGTLIAPNLVLTARHCIEHPTKEPVICGVDTFQPRHVTQTWITTAESLKQTTTGWHHVAEYLTPTTNDACADDIALFVLDDVVAASEAQPADVLAFGPMTDHTRYSTEIAIIGYGLSDPSVGDSFGTRRILEHVPLTCIEGDAPFLDLCPVANVQQLPDGGSDKLLDPKNNFSASYGGCSGDSGSGAYEQWSLTRSAPIVMGVLSRAGSQGNVCFQLAYTRTDVWKDFLVASVKSAAQKGGYAVPGWALGASAPVQPGRATKSDAGPDAAPAAGDLGAACARASDCRSNACVAVGDGPAQCVERCGADGSCAADAICTTLQDTPVCLTATVTTAPGAPQSAPASSGCSAIPRTGARAPNAPLAWSVIAMVGIAALARRRRSR